MNPFINDQKRDIDLPEGCTDLVEMLETARPTPDYKSKWKLVPGLIEAERFLVTRLLTPAKLRQLYIASLPGLEFPMQITHIAGGLSVVLSINCRVTGTLQAVYAVFHAAGVVPIADEVYSYVTTPRRLIICPLPVGGSDGAELIAQLLRNGFSLPEQTPLYFSFNERDAP